MTDNQPVIGEETHILDAKNRIRMFEKVIESYEARENATQGEIKQLRINNLNMNAENAKLRNAIGLWRSFAFAAFITAASSIAAVVACLLGVIG